MIKKPKKKAIQLCLDDVIDINGRGVFERVIGLSRNGSFSNLMSVKTKSGNLGINCDTEIDTYAAKF